MMHQVAPTPSRIPQAIAQKLQSLRRSARIWLLVHSLARFLLMILAFCVVDVLLDWLFRMDRPQRILVGVIVGSVLAYYFVRHVISPLMATISDEALCQRVEKTNPQLAQRLISAVQFSRIDDLESLGVSPAMVDATINEGTQMAAELDFGHSLKQEELQQNWLLLILGVLGIGAICAAVVLGAMRASANDAMSGRDEQSRTWSGLADIWFNRNVLFGDKRWPQKTYLEVIGVDEQGRLVFPRGDDKLLTVLVSEDSRENPDIVRIDIFAKGGRKTLQMNVEGEKHKEFSHMFKNVLSEFEFQVYGGDHESEVYKVVLQPRPEVESLDLVLSPPEYTALGDIQLSREQSPYDVLPGSRLKVNGTTSQSLAKAVLLFPPKPKKRTKSSQETKSNKPTNEIFDVEMTIEDGKHIVVSVEAGKLYPGEYRIRLVNTDGLESNLDPLFNIRELTDEKPSVAVRLRGISSLITDRAVIPIEGNFTDDFAISSVRLLHSWRGESEDTTPTEGSTIPAGIEEKLGKPTIAHTDRFAVEELKLPLGAKLQLQIEVKDNDTYSGPKEKLSDPYYVTVVTSDELRADMLRREKNFRIEFERMIAEQESLSDTCRTMLAQADGRGLMTDAERRELNDLDGKPAEELNADEKKRLAQLQTLAKVSEDIPLALARSIRLQSRMPRRCLAVADQFEAVSIEAENNRLEDKKKHFSEEMPKEIVAPLRKLGEDQIDPATKALEAARRAINKPAVRDEHLAEANAAQEQVVATMRQILNHMVKSEDYQDAVNMMRKIIADQKRVAEESAKARDADLEDIFGSENGDDGSSEPDKKKE